MRTSRCFHLIAQYGPCLASTLAAFAGLGPTIIRGGIDAIRQRRITHTAYLVCSLALGARAPYFPLPSTPAPCSWGEMWEQ
jgi:hypothetical protein